MSDIPKSLGKTYLLIGFLPALIFVLLNAVIIEPIIPEIKKFMSQPILGLNGGFYLLFPLAIGALFVALANPLTRLFEGIFTFQRHFLLKPLMKFNQKRHERIFADLISLKKAYLNEKDKVKRQSLLHRINDEYRKLSEKRQIDLLPYDNRRLLPTDLGNTWAVIEEYPSYRYGMDGVTFWPRLRSCIPNEYLEMIDSENTYVRLLINLSVILGCFGLESIIVASIVQGLSINALFTIILGVGACLGAYLLYRATVALTRTMGDLIKSCFDLYRHELLEEFNIGWEPKTRFEERRAWMGLANYIITGEDAYFPRSPKISDGLTRTKDDANKSYFKNDTREIEHIATLVTEYGINVPLDILSE